MMLLERALIDLLLNIVTRDELNAFLRSPQTTATIIGCLIAISGALLGSFLLLRGMALTSDAISHTVLLGIVVAYLLMTDVFGMQGDTSSPWADPWRVTCRGGYRRAYRIALSIWSLASGCGARSGFPLLFAIAIILVSRFADDVHLDEDAVLVGEIGLAWAIPTAIATSTAPR